MDLDLLNKDFVKLINQRGVHKKLGITSEYIRSLRHRSKTGSSISMDIKLHLLKKSGWNYADKIYDRHDAINLVTFVLKSGPDAKSFGAEYLVDKWETSKN